MAAGVFAAGVFLARVLAGVFAGGFAGCEVFMGALGVSTGALDIWVDALIALTREVLVCSAVSFTPGDH